MKTALLLFWALLLVLPASAQAKKATPKTGIDRDPDIVHLSDFTDEPVELLVVKEAPVYATKTGTRKLGMLQTGQKVVVEAMTERAYKVRGRAEKHGVAGWVAPWAFASDDPEFVGNLKKLYHRQIEVAALIAEKRAAVGMTEEEVALALGKPTKTTVKRTAEGTSGSWEFIDYDDVRHYRYVRDPYSGQVFRQLSHVTREEKGKTVIAFENGVVTSLEESEQRRGGPVKIIVPPVTIVW